MNNPNNSTVPCLILMSEYTMMMGHNNNNSSYSIYSRNNEKTLVDMIYHRMSKYPGSIILKANTALHKSITTNPNNSPSTTSSKFIHYLQWWPNANGIGPNRNSVKMEVQKAVLQKEIEYWSKKKKSRRQNNDNNTTFMTDIDIQSRHHLYYVVHSYYNNKERIYNLEDK